jgi:hypothetical protein
MEKIRVITREKLYDLVWENPLSKLAKKYNLSDNGLRKVCKKLDIPLPKNGHWQKIQFNKKVIIEKLPVNNKVETSITLNFRENSETIINGEGNELNQLTKEIKAAPKNTTLFPEKLTKPNQLIIEAKNDLKTKEPSYYHNIKGLLNTSSGILNITVSPQNVKRALLFMDVFIKTIEKRGHKIEVTDGTKIVIEGIGLSIGVRERLKRKIVKGTYYDSTELYPSNFLSFTLDVYPAKEWTDTINSKIEDKIPNIIAKLELQAVKEKQDDIDRESRNIEYERNRKIEEELEATRNFELIEFKGLFKKANRWHQAEILRKYIAEVEIKAKENNSLTDDVLKWLDWANNKVEWYDPFTEKEDEIFEKVNRETLEYKRW